jgi:hypothetical protein
MDLTPYWFIRRYRGAIMEVGAIEPAAHCHPDPEDVLRLVIQVYRILFHSVD